MNNPDSDSDTEPAFKHELVTLINKHSMENESNTPDFILANYLMLCLKAFNNVTNTREAWYRGKKHE